ncbi:ankyrin repeat-containing protein [Stagonosporopsis vannaccii]|nr:ankyrin repeat-containing protein [Stagonosporopsis vannaccii]
MTVYQVPIEQAAKFQLIDIEEALTENALRTTLNHLPVSLNDTYLRILPRTFQGPEGPAKLAPKRKIFCWIATARRPLRLYELEEGLALEPTDTFLHTNRIPTDSGAKLFSDIGNLAVINDNDKTVSLTHNTVEQFLWSRDNRDDEIADLIALSSSKAEIGDICLAYLDFLDVETQIANAPTQVQLQAPMAHEIVWTNVPFAGHVRYVLAWTSPCRDRAKTGGQDLESLNFAVSLPLALNKKFVLLEYIIDNWIYHTSHLRPYAASWANFQHVALHRQLDLEFQPWNENVHQSRVDGITPKGVYAWALQNAIGSLFGLLDRPSLYDHVYVVRDGLFGGGNTRKADLDMVRGFPQANAEDDSTPVSSQNHLEGWSGGLLL